MSVGSRIAVFMMYEHGANIGLAMQQRDPFGRESEVELFTFEDVARSRIEREWPEIEVIAGFKSALVSNGYPCSIGPIDASADAAGDAARLSDDPMVVMLRVFGFEKCAPLVEGLASPDWIATPLLFAGLFVTDYGAAKFLFDDVGVRSLF